MSEPPRVAPDMVVRVSYQLFDDHGQLVDERPPAEPLEYLDGYAQVIPGLAAGLQGAQVGEQRTVDVPPELGFGERDDGALLELDRADFPGGELVALGDELQATSPDGLEAVYRVVQLTTDSIIADLNHPLAGQHVQFVVQVLGVRPANDEELDAACLDMDERIVYDRTIVYGSQHAPSDGGLLHASAQPLSAEPLSAEPLSAHHLTAQGPAASTGLIQLRSKEKP